MGDRIAIFVLVLFLCVCCTCFTSCTTIEAQTKVVPIEYDYAGNFQPLFDTRPAFPEVVENPQNIMDITMNSIKFQFAFLEMSRYADTLEQAIVNLPKSETNKE